MSDLAEILRIMAQVPEYRNHTAAQLVRTTVPAIDAGQYIVEPDRWFATWAFWNREQITQFLNKDRVTDSWVERRGAIPWLVNFATVPTMNRTERRQLIRYLMSEKWTQFTAQQHLYFARWVGGPAPRRIGRLQRNNGDVAYNY